MKINWRILLWIIIFSVFFFKALIFLDPDFGWHYQMGNVITESGVPKTDPFSYTMPNFLYIDHEWLTDVLIYKLHGLIGMAGLSVVWSVVAILTLYISVEKILVTIKNNFNSKNITTAKNISLMLGGGLIVYQFGIRAQVISWFFFALLFLILSFYKTSKYCKYLLPLLFLLWANMHGSFMLGIFAWGIYLVAEIFKSKKITAINTIIFIISVLITLLNPYGVGLWQEVFNTFFSPPLHGQIEEWKPAWTGLNICFPLVVVFCTIAIFYFRKNFKTFAILILFLIIALSFSALINIPFLAICGAPFITCGILLFENKFESFKFGDIRFNKALKFFVGLSYFLFVFSYLYAVRGSVKFSEDYYYPKKALIFISNNLPSGEIFASYNWGGYLIWKLPQKKVFIDGRMAHWPNALESESQILLGGTDYKEVFSKHNIQMVLWPKEKKETLFINKLKADGWKVVYSDNVSNVFKK